MKDKEVLKLALDALQLIKEADSHYATPKQVCHARALYEPTIKTLEEALAKQEQGEPLFKSIIEKHEGLAEELAAMDKKQGEPVAWALGNNIESDYVFTKETPLYTTPPKCKPLTDEQILRLLSKIDECAVRLPKGLREFAKAIEAAHGIKE